MDPFGFSVHSGKGRKQVEPSLFLPHPRLAAIITFGQSQLANEGDARGLFIPANGVYNFNVFDGACYVARDPLLGTTFARANVATRLGDVLVRSGAYDKVLLVSVAHGGTSISEWAPGGRMHPRAAAAMRRLGDLGIKVTHALWQQGETDAAFGTGADVWIANFRAMISALRDQGLDAPVYVAQSTVCCGAPDEAIRGAQRAVVDPNGGVLPGPDTDVIGPESRWDLCHFSTEGLSLAAELWRRALLET